MRAEHEALVDLQFGEGDLRQLRQRGIAGAKVVDRQAEALQPQARQQAQPARGIGHHRTLGDLQDHVLGLDAVAFDDRLVAVGCGGIGQRHRGHVDRQLQVHAGMVPLLLPAATGIQHAVGEHVGQAFALQHRHEQLRAHHAAIGTLPARQRLHPDHLAVAEFHLRLEPRHDLARVQCLGQRLHAELGVAVVLLVAGMVADLRQHVLELVPGQRLLHAAQHAQAIGAGHGLHGVQQGRVQRAHHHHGARQPLLRDVADAFDAVHARHVQVHQHHVRRRFLLAQHVQRVQSVRPFEHALDAEFGKQAQRDPALEAVVLHHHDLQTRQAHALSPRRMHASASA